MRNGGEGKIGSTGMEGWEIGRMGDVFTPFFHPSILPSFLFFPYFLSLPPSFAFAFLRRDLPFTKKSAICNPQLKMAHAYIGFGSNMGKRFAYINQALRWLLEADGVSLIRASSLYETEPVGYEAQDWFLNGVLAIETSLLPHPLLDVLRNIEKRIGRSQRIRWGPREIDLDLLIYEQCCINTPDLIVPHPEMHRRRFVLIPFAEISPDTVHPILQKNVQALLPDLTDGKMVRLAAPPPF